MKKLFFISGLGANRNVFCQIDEFLGYEKVFIDWIPNYKNETLNNYAARLIKDREITDRDILIGLSFGGLVAQEISKISPVKSIILISSFRSPKDLKPFIRGLLMFRLNYFIPTIKLTFFSSIVRKMFGLKSSEAKKALQQMLTATDPKLTKWSIEQIRKSNYTPNPSISLFSLIGNKDHLVKVWTHTPRFIIPNGGHFMVYENSDEINTILHQLIK